MECPKCETKMEVTHVFQLTGSSETRNLKCPECGYISRSITLLAPQLPRYVGPKKLRRMIEDGTVRVQVDIVPRSSDPSS